MHSLSMKHLKLIQHTMINLAIDRICIAYTEGEINEIMQRYVFYAHKPHFLIPGHI